jgi:hypothetical protein
MVRGLGQGAWRPPPTRPVCGGLAHLAGRARLAVEGLRGRARPPVRGAAPGKSLEGARPGAKKKPAAPLGGRRFLPSREAAAIQSPPGSEGSFPSG